MNNAAFIIIAHLTLRINLKGIDLVRKLLMQPMNLERNEFESCWSHCYSTSPILVDLKPTNSNSSH